MADQHLEDLWHGVVDELLRERDQLEVGCEGRAGRLRTDPPYEAVEPGLDGLDEIGWPAPTRRGARRSA